MFQWNSICYVRIFLINYFPCFNDIFIFWLFGGSVVFHNLITECVKIRLSPGWTFPEADLMNKNQDNHWLIFPIFATRAYEPYFSWRSVTTRSYIAIWFMVNHTKSLIGIIGRKFRTWSGPDRRRHEIPWPYSVSEIVQDSIQSFILWSHPRMTYFDIVYGTDSYTLYTVNYSIHPNSLLDESSLTFWNPQMF